MISDCFVGSAGALFSSDFIRAIVRVAMRLPYGDSDESSPDPEERLRLVPNIVVWLVSPVFGLVLRLFRGDLGWGWR